MNVGIFLLISVNSDTDFKIYDLNKFNHLCEMSMKKVLKPLGLVFQEYLAHSGSRILLQPVLGVVIFYVYMYHDL